MTEMERIFDSLTVIQQDVGNIRERLATLEARQENHLREHAQHRNGDWKRLAVIAIALGGGSGGLSSVLVKLLGG